jgi:hypothetical protein
MPKPEIKEGVRLANHRVFVAGQEEELWEQLTQMQLDRLQASGALAGDWPRKEAPEPPVAAQPVEMTENPPSSEVNLTATDPASPAAQAEPEPVPEPVPPVIAIKAEAEPETAPKPAAGKTARTPKPPTEAK